MGELVISGGSGGFLRDIGTEYQEAAKNFMQFMNDQGAY
ncbi:TPA: integrase, partial [Escherichia coli]|nr:integrase [Escherichia coli]